MNNQIDLISDSIDQQIPIRRIKLIPLWMKIFTWIFLIFGIIVPIGLFFGIMGYSFQISLYGFETDEPLSVIGLGLIAIFAFKGIISFGILKEKDWAIKLGLLDAVVGIIVCVFAMIYPILNEESQLHFTLRLELIALIPYFIKLRKIKVDWEAPIIR